MCEEEIKPSVYPALSVRDTKGMKQRAVAQTPFEISISKIYGGHGLYLPRGLRAACQKSIWANLTYH